MAFHRLSSCFPSCGPKQSADKGCRVQVAEDQDGNLLHLLSEVRDGKSSNPIMFVHTADGVQSATTGVNKLQGDITHRLTGIYDGTKEDYIKAARNSGYNLAHKKRTLKRMGVTKLKTGFGAVIKIASVSAAVLNGVQLVHLWNTFGADGILTQAEIVRMGIEMTEFASIPAAAGEVYNAATQTGDLITVVEDPGMIDAAVNTGIDGVQAAGEAAGGLAADVAEILGSFFCCFT